jgi:Domain of unknown function (DUF4352)
MRRTLLLAAAALLLAGCSTSEPTVNTQPVKAPAVANSSTADAPTKTATSAPAKKAKVGDTLELTDRNTHLQVTLVKLVDPVKSTNEFMTPTAGKRFVAVQMRIVNVGTKVFTDDPMSGTQAKDGDGQVFDASYMPLDTEVGQQMDSGLTLAPGEKTLGVMTFEVPAGVKLVTVEYTNNSFVGHAVQWTLS